MRTSILMTSLLLSALSSADQLPSNGSQDWVPVVVLKENPAPPFRANEEAPVLLGFANAQDVRDGMPLNIGWYLLDPANNEAHRVLAQRFGGSVFRQGDVSVYARGSQERRLTTSAHQDSACLSGTSPMAKDQCSGNTSADIGLDALWRAGNAFFTVGASRERAPAPGLPKLTMPGVLRLQPDVGTRVYTRDSLRLGGAFETHYGEFGLGVALNRMDLGAQFAERLSEGQISVSWLYGSLGGTVTGRTTPGFGRPFDGSLAGLDLGLIWRTPWKGIFTLGARNAVRGKSDASVQPLVESSNERVPYVRYEQDL